MKTETKRVTVYDWLRLIATIWVVLGHSGYIVNDSLCGGVNYSLPENVSPVYYSAGLTFLRDLARWTYGFHMPLFFMLSGAVLAIKPIAAFDKLVRGKIKRLLVPYFVYGLLFMIPVKILGNFYGRDMISTGIRAFLTGEDSGHLWFLSALFWVILIFAIIKKILDRCNIKSVYAVLFIAAILQLTCDFIPFDILGFKMGMSYIAYFAIGYVFETERISNERWNLSKTVTAIAVLLVLEVLNWNYNLLNAFSIIVVGSFVSYLAADILDRRGFEFTHSKKWDYFIRDLFYVYIFHDPLNYLILRATFRLGILSSGVGCVLVVIARTAGVWVISSFMGDLISVLKRKIETVSINRREASKE